jgi:hypothetical protein
MSGRAKQETDGAGYGPYPVASFGITGAEPLRSTNAELDVSIINYSKIWSVII